MFTLIESKPVAYNHYLLTLQTDCLTSTPGQFINIKVNTATDPLIRRPFSIFDQTGNTLQIVVRVVGRGTQQIVNLQPGLIDCIGPFGKGFSIVKGKKALLVGGGVGNAPLYYLAKMLAAVHTQVTYIWGARSESDIFMLDSYKELSHTCIVTTDDGTYGIKGNPVEAAKDIVSKTAFDIVYTCGPEIMMKRLSHELSHLPIEASLERYFGCGIGLCFGCAVATKEGYKRACVDGPVFDAHSVLWDAP
ncbi:MAG: dihydroorotate dehydrogenase electron transfer subunit [Spirochaetes bacterium]|nr:dihydroorotate dehydrogenase electron transfer subunit [Spirochaetota bacterium]